MAPRDELPDEFELVTTSILIEDGSFFGTCLLACCCLFCFPGSSSSNLAFLFLVFYRIPVPRPNGVKRGQMEVKTIHLKLDGLERNRTVICIKVTSRENSGRYFAPMWTSIPLTGYSIAVNGRRLSQRSKMDKINILNRPAYKIVWFLLFSTVHFQSYGPYNFTSKDRALYPKTVHF